MYKIYKEMNSIKIGILGLGAIGQRMIEGIIQHDKVKISAVYDLDVQHMHTVSERFKLRAVSSVEELLKDDLVDAVYLAVPPKFHADLAVKILEAGKHLLCEKPLAATLEEAKHMLDVARKYEEGSTETPLVTAMNFPIPYTGAYEALKKILMDPSFGQVIKIDVIGIFPNWPRQWQINNWIDTKEEGGFVREVFTHFIQLIMSFYGPIEGLTSKVEYPQDLSSSERSLMGWGELSSKVPVSFNGVAQVGAKEHLSVVFYGSEGTLEFVNWRQVFFQTKTIEKYEIKADEQNPTERLLDAFVGKIRGQSGHELVGFDMGFETVRVVETLLGS